MNEVTYREISSEEEGQRVDNYLISHLKGVPKSHIYRMIRCGEIRVNKKRVKANSRLAANDQIRIPPVRTALAKTFFVGSNLEKRLREAVIFEDTQLLVLNKPAGIAVHGGSGESLGLIEALRQTRKELAYLELVHRLDKDTSGCLLLAKKRSVLRSIHALLEQRRVQKTYWALLTHPWKGKKKITVQAALEKNILKSGERMVSVRLEGKPSETQFQLLDNYKQACLVEACPKTGRTHQIRVHAAFIDHVIVGDKKYGSLAGEVEGIDNRETRLFLHARAIEFELNGIKYRFQAEPDDLFTSTLKQLQRFKECDHK